MNKNQDVDRVVFLKSEKTKHCDSEVFAFFPDLMWGNKDYTAYAHTGQHGACALAYAKSCKEATKEEYAPLKKEMEELVGYHLEVISADILKKM